MAARLRKTHQDDVRNKIQVSQLINKLENHALNDDNESEISSSRMKAIEILLRKALPDLSSVEVTGDEDNPLSIINRIEMVALDDDSTDKTTS